MEKAPDPLVLTTGGRVRIALGLTPFTLRATKKEPFGSIEIPCYGGGFKNGAKETRTTDHLHAMRLKPWLRNG